MIRHYKEMIKEINAGKNLETELPKYGVELSAVLKEYALLQLSMEYFGLKEMSDEGLEAYGDAKKELEEVKKLVSEIFVEKQGVAKREELIQRVDTCRNHVIEKMDVLTMYTDKIQIYEYVLNRKELDYVDHYEVIDEEAFKQRLVQYIFGSKDNYVINERIKEAIGQLPIRMLKSRYFDYLKDSLSIYTDSDKKSIDSYIYMLRTCAMLYKPAKSENEYGNLEKIIHKLSNTQYEHLTKEEYQQLCSLVLDSSLYINQITDIYVVIQKVLNYLYVYMLTLPYGSEVDEALENSCEKIITSVHMGFNEMFTEEKVLEVHSLFGEIEGKQEHIFEQYMYLASMLPMVKENYEGMTEALAVKAMFECLYVAEQLCNSSVFIDIHNKEENFSVDKSYVEHQTQQLTMELMELFKTNSQSVNRAVMASTLSKMPVFFNNTDEVMTYITSSLEQCRKVEEKTVAMRLLMDCMDDDLDWSK